MSHRRFTKKPSWQAFRHISRELLRMRRKLLYAGNPAGQMLADHIVKQRSPSGSS